jgi:tRNA threonylcarbamoyladenosine biosynthesis protein TsaE
VLDKSISLLKITYQIEELDQVAKQLVENFTSKIILFEGEMGTGKTTLIKALAKHLGSLDDVSSPTFSIVNEYKTLNSNIYHFDMYRIESEVDALNFGFDDYLNSDSWIFIEWPNIISNLLEENVDFISISLEKNTSRTLKLSQNINLTEQKPMSTENLT